jgi:putative transposase
MTMIAYIHYNPVKHGLAAAAREWPYSSFHRYVAEDLCAAEWGVGKNIRLPEVVGRE